MLHDCAPSPDRNGVAVAVVPPLMNRERLNAIARKESPAVAHVAPCPTSMPREGSNKPHFLADRWRRATPIAARHAERPPNQPAFMSSRRNNKFHTRCTNEGRGDLFTTSLWTAWSRSGLPPFRSLEEADVLLVWPHGSDRRGAALHVWSDGTLSPRFKVATCAERRAVGDLTGEREKARRFNEI